MIKFISKFNYRYKRYKLQNTFIYWGYGKFCIFCFEYNKFYHTSKLMILNIMIYHYFSIERYMENVNKSKLENGL